MCKRVANRCSVCIGKSLNRVCSNTEMDVKVLFIIIKNFECEYMPGWTYFSQACLCESLM